MRLTEQMQLSAAFHLLRSGILLTPHRRDGENPKEVGSFTPAYIVRPRRIPPRQGIFTPPHRWMDHGGGVLQSRL